MPSNNYFITTVGQTYPKKINDSKKKVFFTLEANGAILARGANDSGSLGVGHDYVTRDPTTVSISDLPADDRVVDIFAGLSRTLFLTERGRVYASGWNLHGNFGIGTKKDVYTPQRVLIPDHECVKEIIAPYNLEYSLFFVMKSGKIFACGENGVINEEHWKVKRSLVTYPDMTYLGVGHAAKDVPTPEFVMQLNADEVLLDIKTGREIGSRHNHVLAVFFITDQRTLVYGNNSKGEFGVGHARPIMKPTPLELPYNEKVAGIYLNSPSGPGCLTTFIFTQSGRVMLCGESFSSEPDYIQAYKHRMPSLEYYHCPPLLIRVGGAIGVIESGDVILNWNAKRGEIIQKNLVVDPLLLPHATDVIIHMELHGYVWWLIGKEQNYVCYKNRYGKTVIAPETAMLTPQFDLPLRGPSPPPTSAGVHLSGGYQGNGLKKQPSEGQISNGRRTAAMSKM